MRIERTAKMYRIRIDRKIASQVKTDSLMKIIVCFVIFSWIFCTCESYFNRVLICTFKTRISILNNIVFDLIFFSNFEKNELTHTWSRQTRTRVESLISRTTCALFRDFDNFHRCSFPKSECLRHSRIFKISCSYRVCCTFSIDQRCKTNTK
jgi:hypothetical protein